MNKKNHGGQRKNAGRRPLPEDQRRKSVNVRLRPDQILEWDQQAKAMPCTRTKLLELWILGNFLKKIKK